MYTTPSAGVPMNNDPRKHRKEYRNINLPSVLVIGILRKIIGISFQR